MPFVSSGLSGLMESTLNQDYTGLKRRERLEDLANVRSQRRDRDLRAEQIPLEQRYKESQIRLGEKQLAHEESKMAQESFKQAQAYAAQAALMVSDLPPEQQPARFSELIQQQANALPDPASKEYLMNLLRFADDPKLIRQLPLMYQGQDFDRAQKYMNRKNTALQSRIDAETEHRRALELERLKQASSLRGREISASGKRSGSGAGQSTYAPTRDQVEYYGQMLAQEFPGLVQDGVLDQSVAYNFAQRVNTKTRQGLPEPQAFRESIAEMSRSLNISEKPPGMIERARRAFGADPRTEQSIGLNPGREGEFKYLMTQEGRLVEYVGRDEQGRQIVKDPATGEMGVIEE